MIVGSDFMLLKLIVSNSVEKIFYWKKNKYDNVLALTKNVSSNEQIGKDIIS